LRWFDKLEKHLGFIALPHLGLSLVAAQAIAYLLSMQDPAIGQAMLLDPARVAAGEWWRLFTYIIVPSSGRLSLIFAIFWFQFFWMMSSSLEAEWGRFRLTLYFFTGLLLPAALSMAAWQFLGWQLIFSGQYFSMSVQLAFAYLAPELTMYFYFILPVKMRWWAWAIGAYLLFQIWTGGTGMLAIVLAGLGNYLLFFFPDYWQAFRLRKQTAEGRRVFAQAKQVATQVQVRACHECGRGPRDADLRLCTCERCGEEGRHWCVEHLQAHLPGQTKRGRA
jgi:hypothetical protein